MSFSQVLACSELKMLSISIRYNIILAGGIACTPLFVFGVSVFLVNLDELRDL